MVIGIYGPIYRQIKLNIRRRKILLRLLSRYTFRLFLKLKKKRDETCSVKAKQFQNIGY
jgi:hypothetical protein